MDQWAMIAGQAPGKYCPTYQDAITLRLDWLNSMQIVDPSKHDHAFAAELFYNVARENHRRGLYLTEDRAKDCG